MRRQPHPDTLDFCRAAAGQDKPRPFRARAPSAPRTATRRPFLFYNIAIYVKKRIRPIFSSAVASNWTHPNPFVVLY